METANYAFTGNTCATVSSAHADRATLCLKLTVADNRATVKHDARTAVSVVKVNAAAGRFQRGTLIDNQLAPIDDHAGLGIFARHDAFTFNGARALNRHRTIRLHGSRRRFDLVVSVGKVVSMGSDFGIFEGRSIIQRDLVNE